MWKSNCGLHSISTFNLQPQFYVNYVENQMWKSNVDPHSISDRSTPEPIQVLRPEFEFENLTVTFVVLQVIPQVTCKKSRGYLRCRRETGSLYGEGFFFF
jgi:hypothetical protein